MGAQRSEHPGRVAAPQGLTGPDTLCESDWRAGSDPERGLRSAWQALFGDAFVTVSPLM